MTEKGPGGGGGGKRPKSGKKQDNVSQKKYVPVNTDSTDSNDTTSVIGRPLVPFFLPGAELQENTEQKVLHLAADEYKRSSVKVPVPNDAINEVIHVRTFEKDGYFSEPKKVVIKQSLSSLGNEAVNVSTSTGKKKSKNKKGASTDATSNTGNDATVKASCSSGQDASTVKYANPSFFQSPDPVEIPLPKFLERFDVVGESLVPPAARSSSPPVPTLKKQLEKRLSSPVGTKSSMPVSNPLTPIKPPLIGESSSSLPSSVQKPNQDSTPLPPYQLISPAKLKQSVSSNAPAPTPITTVIPKPSSRLN